MPVDAFRCIAFLCLVATGLVHGTNGVMTGSGTSADPFLVGDYADLKAVGVGTTYSLNSVYKVIADIDASPSATEDTGHGFRPVGTYNAPFSGIFHGAGHVIQNLHISRRNTRDIGLFGCIRNGEIDNIGLSGVSVSEGEITGALAATVENSTITGCFAIGTVWSSYSSGRVGGLVGIVSRHSTINGCFSEGSVQTYQYLAGGLAGFCSDTSAIIDCHATAIVKGISAAGGLIGGMADGCEVIRCYATGPVTDTARNAGGLIGSIYGSCLVSDCYATGPVTGGKENTGGLIGQSQQYSTVIRCHAAGPVKGKDFSVGGLIGNNDRHCTVSGCYATGPVTGTSASGTHNVGGLIGKNYDNCSVTDCYATGAVSDSNTSTVYAGGDMGGLVGRNERQSSVTQCYATGSVTGKSFFVGGLVGGNYYTSTVSSSYATGQVWGSVDVGGLVGTNQDTSMVIGCYAAGPVAQKASGTTISGLVGDNNDRSTVTGCYWDRERSGLKSVKYNFDTAVSTSRMKQQSCFIGWDFSALWRIRGDSTYPGLRTQDNAPFAFIDTIETQRTLSLSSLFTNDCDVETARDRLTVRVLALSNGSTDSVNTFSFPAGAVYGDTASILYRIGEIRNGDTLWGNRTTAFVTFDNISSVASPRLVSPANCVINQPIALLPMEWTPVSGANTYHIKIATDSTFKDIFLEDSTLTSTTLPLGGLANYTIYYWRVRAKDGAGVSAWSTCRRFRTIPLPPPTPVLVSPADAAVAQALSPSLGWKQSLAAEKYYVQVARDTGFSDLIADSTVTDTIFYRVRGLEYLSTYFWRVKAQNISGISDWSGYWSFATCMPPPALISPEDSASNLLIPVSLVWSTASTAVSYHIQVATDRYFSTVFKQDSMLVDTMDVMSGLANGTTYYWRVRGKNAGGYAGAWSATRRFSTIALPQAPVLVFPFNGIPDMPVSLPLVWNRRTNTQSYHIQIATDSIFTTLFMQDSALTDTVLVTSGFSHSTIYYWRVRGKNAGGAGAWAGYWKFTTVIAPPETPSLISPVNSSAAMTVSPMLAWNKVNTATRYHVQVASDVGFASFFMQDSTLADPLKRIFGLENSTTYFWRVRAINAGGGSGWSPYWTFTTTAADPGVPRLVSPASMSTDQPVSLTLVWNSVSGATGYQFQVATDTAFARLFKQDVTSADSLEARITLDNNVTYYWRVRAENTGGSGAWSNVWCFTTIIPLPAPVILSAPKDSAVFSVDSVRLSWNMSPLDVDRYMLEVAVDPAMTNILVRDSSLTGTTKLLTSLVYNKTYYWRVRAHNAAGWGDFSEQRRFITKSNDVLFRENAISVFSLKYKAGTLFYTLPKQCFVRITYYDIQGRTRGSFAGLMQGAGNYRLDIPASSWGAGTYVQVFEAGEIVRKDRLMIIK